MMPISSFYKTTDSVPWPFWVDTAVDSSLSRCCFDVSLIPPTYVSYYYSKYQLYLMIMMKSYFSLFPPYSGTISHVPNIDIASCIVMMVDPIPKHHNLFGFCCWCETFLLLSSSYDSGLECYIVELEWVTTALLIDLYSQWSWSKGGNRWWTTMEQHEYENADGGSNTTMSDLVSQSYNNAVVVAVVAALKDWR